MAGIARTYIVGVPLAITVHGDGSVTLEVDLSEAHTLSEDVDADEQYGEEAVEADSTIVGLATQQIHHALITNL